MSYHLDRVLLPKPWILKGGATAKIFRATEQSNTGRLLYTLLYKGTLVLRVLVARVFELKEAYLVDLFGHLNILNLKFRGPEMIVIQLIDAINAFI